MTSIESGNRIWLTTGNNQRQTINTGKKYMRYLHEAKFILITQSRRYVDYYLLPRTQKAGLPFPKATRLSFQTRSFPSLPHDRFDFVTNRLSRISHIVNCMLIPIRKSITLSPQCTQSEYVQPSTRQRQEPIYVRYGIKVNWSIR
jgi:hypothetical protein